MAAIWWPDATATLLHAIFPRRGSRRRGIFCAWLRYNLPRFRRNPACAHARSHAHARPDKPDDNKIAGTAAFSKFMAVLQLIADQEAPLHRAAGGAVGLSAPHGLSHPRRAHGRGHGGGKPAQQAIEVGPRLIHLASRAWDRSDIRTTAIEPLRQLRDITRETVHLAVPSDHSMVYIEKLESPQAVRMASRIGTRVTLYSSSVGKAYLAGLEQTRRENLMRSLQMEAFTEHTHTDLEALREDLEQTRARLRRRPRRERSPDLLLRRRHRRPRWRAGGLREREHPAVPAPARSAAGLCGATAASLRAHLAQAGRTGLNPARLAALTATSRLGRQFDLVDLLAIGVVQRDGQRLRPCIDLADAEELQQLRPASGSASCRPGC
jgi:hypothetical protein